MFKQVLGRSPLLYGVKKIHSHLFFRGGSENNLCLSDEAFFEIMTETIPDKPRRLNNREVQELLSSTAKLTKEQRLLKSVIEEAKLSKAISEKSFQNIQEMYAFRRKYKNYLRIKRVAPFTGTELSCCGIWVKINFFNVTGACWIFITCVLFFPYVIVLRTRQTKTCLSSV